MRLDKILLIVVLSFSFLFTPGYAAVCGDSICESDEELTCYVDCVELETGPEGEILEAPPAAPVCGNAICELDETSGNCPQDCFVLPLGIETELPNLPRPVVESRGIEIVTMAIIAIIIIGVAYFYYHKFPSKKE